MFKNWTVEIFTNILRIFQTMRKLKKWPDTCVFFRWKFVNLFNSIGPNYCGSYFQKILWIFFIFLILIVHFSHPKTKPWLRHWFLYIDQKIIWVPNKADWWNYRSQDWFFYRLFSENRPIFLKNIETQKIFHNKMAKAQILVKSFDSIIYFF